ncbi:unnamed protein product, partial [Prorocentrum cordatum]
MPGEAAAAASGAAGGAAMVGAFAAGPAWAGKRGLAAATDQNDPNKQFKSKGAGKGKDWDRVGQIAVTSAKLALVVAKDVQDQRAAVYEAWEMGAAKPLPTFAIQAGQQCVADAKELTEQHMVDSQTDAAALGPPHLMIAAATIKGLATLVGPEAKKVLEEFWRTVVCAEGSEPLGSCIAHFQAKKNKAPNEEEKVRLIFSFDLHERNMKLIRGIIIAEIKRDGGQRKLGEAPRGPLQRELNRLLVGEPVPQVQTRARLVTPDLSQSSQSRGAPRSAPPAFRDSQRYRALETAGFLSAAPAPSQPVPEEEEDAAHAAEGDACADAGAEGADPAGAEREPVGACGAWEPCPAGGPAPAPVADEGEPDELVPDWKRRSERTGVSIFGVLAPKKAGAAPDGAPAAAPHPLLAPSYVSKA